MGLPGERSNRWRYSVCGLLLLATMLNYMDRQTLSQMATTIRAEYHLGSDHYGSLEMGFGLAFAAGAFVFGLLADRISIRWLYPAVLLCWSLAGIATAAAPAIGVALAGWLGSVGVDTEDISRPYLGFLACRIALGFFEAGHWPCALVTTHTIMVRKDRSFGNSILQSGAAIGAILTPLIVLILLPAPDAADRYPPGTWRMPFVAIGLIGMTWALPWLALVRGHDLDRHADEAPPTDAAATAARSARLAALRMYVALVVVVVMINLTWQFFRAWLPMFMEEGRGYSKREVLWFTSAYYIATDAGCIGAGYLAKWLASRGWEVHRARLLTFGLCTALTLLSFAVIALPAGPLLVCVLLLIGAGALGLFPNYYSFTQELSKTHQGKVSGSLGTITWVGSALMQQFVGNNIQQTQDYTSAIQMAGVAPVLALLAMLLLWPRPRKQPAQAEE
jgi:ACS family hexuronate transporter-like MFS transporter